MSSMLTDLLGLSVVRRWGTHPTGREQSVAEHSFAVAVVALAIRERLPLDTRGTVDEARLLRYALVHDGPESLTGDMPRPFKAFLGRQRVNEIEAEICPWFGAERTKPSAVEFQLVHIADNIEALAWLSRWGHGFKCKFDGHVIEDQFRKSIWDDAAMMESELAGSKSAILGVLAEVAS